MMETKTYCQSCGIPLDANVFGTEKDGTFNHEYCKYCYRDGHFTHPDWDLEDMSVHLFKMMDRNSVPAELIENVISRLANLKRWRKSTPGSR